DQLLEAAKTAGSGWKVTPIPAEVFNVNANDRDWVNRQCTGQSIETFQQRIKLSGGISEIKNVTYVLPTGFREGTPFPPFYEEAKAKGWKTVTIECGHDVMLDRPEDLVSLLLDAGAASQTARSSS